MLPEQEQERAILNVKKVLDGRAAVVPIQPPLINLQPRGRPVGAKNLPQKSTKRDASLFEQMEDRSGKRMCGVCGLIGHNRRSCPSVDC